jgi:hypothetical protein
MAAITALGVKHCSLQPLVLIVIVAVIDRYLNNVFVKAYYKFL